jgi:riboflavin kinase
LQSSSSAKNRRLQNFLFTLLKLAELGATAKAIKISTDFLAAKMGSSQQTASRHLVDLQRIGWIRRSITHEGSLVRITDAGRAQLNSVFSRLSSIFELKYPPTVTLEGVVFSGFGEGAYYVTREPYRRGFVEKLGFDPYPGTLNLRLTSEYDIKTRAELENYPAIEISGFKNENRSYGPVRCFHALINNREKAAVVCALRSHYNTSAIEIISPVYLRGRLDLKDGHKAKVEVFPNLSSEKTGS